MQEIRDPCILHPMNVHQQTSMYSPKRRQSRLAQRLADEKVERAKRQTPEERLAIALRLSDFCYELTQCSPKP